MWLLLPLPIGFAWVVDLPSRQGTGSVWAGTRPQRDPSVSHPETLERGGEVRVLWDSGPVYVVHWFC